MVLFIDDFEYPVTQPNIIGIGGWTSLLLMDGAFVGDHVPPYHGANAGRLATPLGANPYFLIKKNFTIGIGTEIIIAIKFLNRLGGTDDPNLTIGLENGGLQTVAFGFNHLTSDSKFYYYSNDRFPLSPYGTSLIDLPALGDWFLARIVVDAVGVKMFVDLLHGAGWQNIGPLDGYVSYVWKANDVFYLYGQYGVDIAADYARLSTTPIPTDKFDNPWWRCSPP
jgi:hypothetical protein